MARAPRKHGYTRLSTFELERREERRALIAAARANGVEHVLRDGRVYTLVHLPAVEPPPPSMRRHTGDMGAARSELLKLQDQQARASAKVDELEQAHRLAVAAAQEASTALAEGERHGLSAARRSELEEALADAKAKASEPHLERIAGAKQAASDCAVAIRQHVTENLRELVEADEADGRPVADRMTELASSVLAVSGERERIERSLGGFLVKAGGSVSPGDVSYSKAAAFVAAARALLDSGGETPVTVSRIRPPWDHLLGPEAVAEAVAS